VTTDPLVVAEIEKFYKYAREMYGYSRSGADRWLSCASSERLDAVVDQIRDADKLLRFKAAWDRLSSEQRQQVVNWVEVLSATGRQVDQGPASPQTPQVTCDRCGILKRPANEADHNCGSCGELI